MMHDYQGLRMRCFTSTVTINKGENFTYNIINRYMLSQQNALFELKYIASLLGGYVEKASGCDRIVINSLNGTKIIEYINRYQLRSKKALAFTKWVELNTISQTKGLTEKQVMEIKAKAALINFKGQTK